MGPISSAPSGSADYRLIDLSIPIANRPGRRNPVISYDSHEEVAGERAAAMGFDPADLPDPGIHFATEHLQASVHGSGTHVDAPWHYGPTSEFGAARSIDELPLEWFFGPAVVLDLTGMPEGSVVEPPHIDEALLGHELQAGDIVLMRVGVADEPWSLERIREVSRASIEHLLDEGVRTIGVDAASPERSHLDELKMGRPERYFPVHTYGRKREFCLVEMLTNLDVLPHHGFQVALFPVKIARGSGGWCRAVAFVPAD
jgi:kynurenine formamidase